MPEAFSRRWRYVFLRHPQRPILPQATASFRPPCCCRRSHHPTTCISPTGRLPSKSSPTASDQNTSYSLTYDKTLTERLGVGVTLGYDTIDFASGGSTAGWQNVATFMQYLLVVDPAGEFVMTTGLEHEWGRHRRPPRGRQQQGHHDRQSVYGQRVWRRGFGLAASAGTDRGAGLPGF